MPPEFPFLESCIITSPKQRCGVSFSTTNHFGIQRPFLSLLVEFSSPHLKFFFFWIVRPFLRVFSFKGSRRSGLSLPIRGIQWLSPSPSCFMCRIIRPSSSFAGPYDSPPFSLVHWVKFLSLLFLALAAPPQPCRPGTPSFQAFSPASTERVRGSAKPPLCGSRTFSFHLFFLGGFSAGGLVFFSNRRPIPRSFLRALLRVCFIITSTHALGFHVCFFLVWPLTLFPLARNSLRGSSAGRELTYVLPENQLSLCDDFPISPNDTFPDDGHRPQSRCYELTPLVGPSGLSLLVLKHSRSSEVAFAKDGAINRNAFRDTPSFLSRPFPNLLSPFPSFNSPPLPPRGSNACFQDFRNAIKRAPLIMRELILTFLFFSDFFLFSLEVGFSLFS